MTSRRPLAGLAHRLQSLSPATLATLIGLGSIVPLFIWWLGWFPGFLSSDSVDQWGQVVRGEFSNRHPAVHTWLMWLLSRVWESPGVVTLAQVLAMGAVLALAARRLTEIGGRPLGSGLAVVAIAAVPAVSITTIALWKDVPFTIALVWLFAELVGWAARPSRLGSPVVAVRIGLAIALVWMLRHNGFITIVLLAPILVVALWRHRRPLAVLVGTTVAAITAVNLVLYPLIDVDRTAIEPATVFISDVAASFVHEPDNFTADETRYLLSIAPREVWVSAYSCTDSTPLAFAEEFDGDVIAADAGRFLDLVIRTYLRDPDTVLGHRWCAASYLLVPAQPSDGYFHRPPFDIAANDLGIVRTPISDRAFSATFAVFQWIEPPGRLWLTWRPGLAVWAALVATVVLVRRRRWRPLLPALALIVAQGINVAATTPAQEFRFAFGIYVMCLLLVAVAWAATRSGGSPSGESGYRPGDDG